MHFPTKKNGKASKRNQRKIPPSLFAPQAWLILIITLLI